MAVILQETFYNAFSKKESCCILNRFSLKFVPRGPIATLV